MPCSRNELEDRERLCLASYAQHSAETRGRRYAEAPPEWRTEFQRDRDRVIHSRAFRRLEYKTQVFLNGTGDHLRTRLTHTLEVAGIARNIARALRLNEDLTETIALAHDLGHAPFGHRGEHALDRLMKQSGGFEHNKQSLRVVEWLEQKYPKFPGLNLTWEVREGLDKHHTVLQKSSKNTAPFGPSASLEAQVANLADEIAYYSHDLDDGLTSGLLNERRLEREVDVWSDAARWVKREFGRLPDECRRYYIIRCIIDDQVKNVVHQSERRLEEAKIQTADDVRLQQRPMIAYNDERRRANLALRKYLYRYLYYNTDVQEPNRRAVRMLDDLFPYFLDHRKEVSGPARRRSRLDGWPRAVCDHLAGMTDRYAILEHQRLFGVKI